MVLNLSKEEVLKVCGACDRFIRESESCRHESDGVKSLKEVHRCRKWDQTYGCPCLYR
jgi:predicted RNA-binding Zn-ribbon protein involved in translation (DUF1610 family)